MNFNIVNCSCHSFTILTTTELRVFLGSPYHVSLLNDLTPPLEIKDEATLLFDLYCHCKLVTTVHSLLQYNEYSTCVATAHEVLLYIYCNCIYTLCDGQTVCKYVRTTVNYRILCGNLIKYILTVFGTI